MLLLTLILYLMPISSIKAQNLYNQPPGSIVPSEQTAQNFAKAPSEAERPNLRYGPGSGDSGFANQETPLPIESIDTAILLSLFAFAFIYIIQTKKRKKHEN